MISCAEVIVVQGAEGEKRNDIPMDNNMVKQNYRFTRSLFGEHVYRTSARYNPGSWTQLGKNDESKKHCQKNTE